MTPKKRVLFQTPLKPEPVSHIARATPSAAGSSSAVAGSSRSQMHVTINKGNCASTDCLMEETSLKKIKKIELEKEAEEEEKLQVKKDK